VSRTANRTAVVVLSDPKSGSEESLGRLFNALGAAHDARAHGGEVAIVFAGAGTRWPGELAKVAHPAAGLYDSVRELVRGASCACATVFGATESVEACGVPLLSGNKVPGTPGLLSLSEFLQEGWNVLVF